MSRGERVRVEAEAQYPALRRFFVCSLHPDCLIDYETPEDAIDAAIAEHPFSHRQLLYYELAALLNLTGDDTRLRLVLNDGFGVALSFRKAAEARAFAEGVKRKLRALPKTRRI
jgi:hypothetical protein